MAKSHMSPVSYKRYSRDIEEVIVTYPEEARAFLEACYALDAHFRVEE